MKINILSAKGKELYTQILRNKLITICILFTVFTLLDTIPILFGLWPPKVGIGPYVHLLGRFILHSLLVFGLYIYHVLKKRIASKLIIYLVTFFLTWGLLMGYLWMNTLIIELHPDAFLDGTISYVFMYLLFGIVIFISNMKKNHNKF